METGVLKYARGSACRAPRGTPGAEVVVMELQASGINRENWLTLELKMPFALCLAPRHRYWAVGTWLSPLDTGGNSQELHSSAPEPHYCQVSEAHSCSLLRNLCHLQASSPALGVLSLAVNALLHAIWSRHRVPAHLSISACRGVPQPFSPPPAFPNPAKPSGSPRGLQAPPCAGTLSA